MRLIVVRIASNKVDKKLFMIKYVGILMLAIVASLGSMAQTGTVKGRVIDVEDKFPLKAASVQLLLQNDSSIVKSTITDDKGMFLFTQVPALPLILIINNTSYDQYSYFFTGADGEKDLVNLAMQKKSTKLEAVVIVAKAPNATIKGDTAQFSASQYKVNPDATVEDLIKKMPGITIDKAGNVTAQGEAVKKVTIDGKDFFGDDATAALRNLPSDVVDKIQVYDRQSDQARLTGFDDGNSVKAINVVTKSGLKNGQFGRLYAGAGTDDRYAAGGNVSIFKGDQKITFIGNFNNTNQQNFASQDLLGVTSRGGGGGGGGGRGWGNSNPFQTSSNGGINTTNALGVNFADKWGAKKNINVSGSYFFNNSNNVSESRTNTETFASPQNQLTNSNDFGTSKNYNHRINMRMEYNIDSNNTLIYTPSLSFQKNNALATSNFQTFLDPSDSVLNYNGQSISERNGYNIGNNLTYRRSFAKKGRSATVSINSSFSKNNSDIINTGNFRFFKQTGIVDSVQNQLNDNFNDASNLGINISYTEPISEKVQVEVKYEPSFQKSNADQKTFNDDGGKYSLLQTDLSNVFENRTNTQSGGASLRFNLSKETSFAFGANVQNVALNSDRTFPTTTTVRQSFTNILPNAFIRAKTGQYSNVRVFFRGYTSLPSVTQLQDVVNISSPLRVSVGNANLKQSAGIYLGSRYSYANKKNNQSFFGGFFFQTAQDYITNATFIASSDSTIDQGKVLNRGSQLAKPVNLDGFRSLRANATYSMPLKFIKTNLNISGGYNYSKLPGLVNNKLTSTITNNYSTGLTFASNISQYVDFNVNYNLNISNSATTGGTIANNNFTNQGTGVTLNLLSKKGWFVLNDVSYQVNSGLTDGFNQNFVLWNAGVGKKFFKGQKGELKLSVFDLLKQNQSITRNITGTYREDVLTNVLQQYFLLTFSYNLKNFGTGATAAKGNGGANGAPAKIKL